MPIKVLNIAEKPSVAREITQILSQGKAQKRPGLSKYNAIHEFLYNLRGENVTMVFTSVSGHLMGMDFPAEYKAWNSCDPVRLFDAPVEKFVPEGMQQIAKTLKREARGCKKLILWLDCDREGENIAFEVVETCRQVAPGLEILRAHFSAVIPKEIYKAMQTLTAPNVNDSLAVDARIELDLRIGAVFTRFQTMRLQNKFQGLSESVISYGPCQFPTLGFVVERYWRIQNFVPENFWQIECSVKRKDGVANFSWQRFRLFDKVACVVLYEMCMDNPEATVIEVESKPKRKYRPFPMTTVELQKQAARKLRISSEETMKLAESLYQSGYISYPRTETDTFPDGTDFTGLIGIHTAHPQWGQYASSLLNEDKFRRPKQGKHNDNSHPPIHPTKLADNLPPNQKPLYEFIVRHFLACCSEDALGLETRVTIDIAGEKFTTKGLVVEQYNWLEVFPYEKWTDKNIPAFKLHERFIPTSLTMHEGTTTAPSLLSEAELIALMDEKGIGTDATIAQHIQTIQERGYAVKQMPGALFAPTTLGEALVLGYNTMGLELSKPELRAETEANMLLVSKGMKTKEQFIREAVAKYKEVFLKVVREAQKLDQSVAKYFDSQGTSFAEEIKNFSECGKCHSPMNLRIGNDNNRVLFCRNCNEFHSLQRSGDLTPHNHRCPLCGFQVITVNNTEKNTTYVFCPYCRNNPPQDQVPIPTGVPFTCRNCSARGCPLATKQSSAPVRTCPVCNSSQMSIRKKKDDSGYFLGCKGYPNCKHTTRLPDGIVQLSVTTQICNSCLPGPTYKLQFLFKRSAIPLGMDPEYIGCIGCDEFLKELADHSGGPSTADRDRDRTQYQPTTSSSYASKPPTAKALTSSYNHLAQGISSSNNNSYSSKSNYTPSSSPSFTMNRKNTNTTSYNQKNTNTTSYSQKSSAADSSDAPLCTEHQQPAVQRTVVKEGENKGKKFWTCGMPDKCKFFQWVDQPPQQQGSSYQGSNSYGKSAARSTGDNRCFVCNQPGHFASSCPNKDKKRSSSYQHSSSSSWGQKQKLQRTNFNKGDTTRKKKRCTICKQEGHDKRFHDKSI